MPVCGKHEKVSQCKETKQLLVIRPTLAMGTEKMAKEKAAKIIEGGRAIRTARVITPNRNSEVSDGDGCISFLHLMVPNTVEAIFKRRLLLLDYRGPKTTW